MQDIQPIYSKSENLMSNDQKDSQPEKPKSMSVGALIALGVAIGAGIGVSLDNFALGIGVAIGTAIGAARAQRSKDN